MTSPANLGFETAGTNAGEALHWTFASLATAEVIADFDGGSGGPRPQEGFELDWSNSPYLFAFGGGDTTAAIYAVGIVIPPPAAENLELGWDNGDTYLFEMGPSIGAEYGAGPINQENFEQEWSNDGYLTAMAGTVVANFAQGTAYENFDEWDWMTYLTSFAWPPGTGTTAASYDGAAPQAFEDFEQTKLPVIFTADPSTDVFTTPVAHLQVNGDKVNVQSDEILPLGLSPKNDYRVISATTFTFQLSTIISGSAQDIGSPGGGQMTVTGDKSVLWVLFL
jgi:hypothetical protein